MDIAELHKRAEQGNVVAQSLLGLCYLSGEDVRVDCAQALHYLALAASEGASRAMLNLGRMYAQGLGVSQDAAKAIGVPLTPILRVGSCPVPSILPARESHEC